MAILKIISHGKNNKAKREVLRYVLNQQKTREDLCYVSGDYQRENITDKDVFAEFQRVRKLFGKDKSNNSRTYTHGTIAFAEGEITPEEAKEFVCEFVDKVYPNHQVLVATHTDTKHIHAHFVIETVSYVDGTMLHTSKHDLNKAKEICNLMCEEHLLHVPQKGEHYDGTKFENGEMTIWEKNKYQMLMKQPMKSYLMDLLGAIKKGLEKAKSRAEFCNLMENEYGWSVIWKDSRKNITFKDSEGHKVRDSSLNKTFGVKIDKEVLEKHFMNKEQPSRSIPKKRVGRRR